MSHILSRILNWQFAVVAALFMAGVGCTKSTAPGAAAPGATTQVATEEDSTAVQNTVLGLLEVYNQPKASSLSVDERAAAIGKFYVPDSAFAPDDAAMFFGPPRQPLNAVIVGTAAHVMSMSKTYDDYVHNGLSYNLQLTTTQIRMDGSLAVVIARTLGIIRTANGDVVATAPGRWTIVLERIGGRWLISHEHISFINTEGARS